MDTLRSAEVPGADGISREDKESQLRSQIINRRRKLAIADGIAFLQTEVLPGLPISVKDGPKREQIPYRQTVEEALRAAKAERPRYRGLTLVLGNELHEAQIERDLGKDAKDPVLKATAQRAEEKIRKLEGIGKYFPLNYSPKVPKPRV